MAELNLQIVGANLVAAYQQLQLPGDLTSKVEPLLRSPRMIGTPVIDGGELGLLIMSVRDQVSITVSPRRFILRDESGGTPGGKKIATAAWQLVNLLSPTILSYGFNYDLEVSLSEQDKAGFVITRAALNELRIRERLGSELVGSGIRLFYKKGSKVYNLLVEPKLQQFEARTLYAHINVHEESSLLPPEDALIRAFAEEYQAFTAVVERLLR